jgi:hypothetical protein
MAKPLCVGSSKPTIKDNRLKTGFLSFVSNTCKDFTEFAAVNYDKWDICGLFQVRSWKYLFINLSKKRWLENLVTGTRVRNGCRRV